MSNRNTENILIRVNVAVSLVKDDLHITTDKSVKLDCPIKQRCQRVSWNQMRGYLFDTVYNSKGWLE